MLDETKNGMRHYAALEKESERTGWPLNYKRDLTVHDRAFCERVSEGNPFVWVLRDSGTHIIFPSANPNNDHGSVRPYLIPGFIAEAFGPGARFYAWDGSKLRPLQGADQASEFLKAEYVTNGGKL